MEIKQFLINNYDCKTNVINLSPVSKPKVSLLGNITPLMRHLTVKFDLL